MLSLVVRSFTVAPLVSEELKCSAPVEEVLGCSEDAKAPWDMAAPAPACSKSLNREALLQLLSSGGASLAAQRLALDILMKLVTGEAEKLDAVLFARVLSSLLESKCSLLEYFLSKYFVENDIRDHASSILKLKCSNEGELFCDMDATKALQGVFTGTISQNGATERAELVSLNLNSGLLPDRSYDPVLFPDSECDDDQSSDEQDDDDDDGCKANAPVNPMQEPGKEIVGEDLSSLIHSAARVRDTEANNSKGGATRIKPGDEEDDDGDEDEEPENDQGGGESGGDEEGESDEPEQGGNEEEEEGEEEEEEENEEEDDEDDDQAQAPQQQLNLPNSTNNNNGGEFDEEDEDENDGGGVEQDDDDDEDGAEDEEDENEEDLEAAPPKKKQKK